VRILLTQGKQGDNQVWYNREYHPQRRIVKAVNVGFQALVPYLTLHKNLFPLGPSLSILGNSGYEFVHKVF